MVFRVNISVAKFGRAQASNSIILSCLLSIAPITAQAQSVVSDGGSVTGITIEGSGLVNVDIAPANSASISHNTYSAFSVPEAGVNLNNTTVGATTILNEVTSTNLTTIEGALTVIGSQADVIIANPNGIVVNGGRFQNVGNVALTTGAIGADLNGVLTSSVAIGEIAIGTNGLSGTMEELALVSQKLRIDGTLSLGTAHVNAIVGNSVVSFDRDRAGLGQNGLGLLPWAVASDRGSASTDALIVDITNQGSINAGRISVTVTDQGAGVRFAGNQLASAGGFRLTSSGHLELVNSSIDASGSVNIESGSVALVSDATGRAEINSQSSGVVIDAQSGDIDLGQGRVSGRIVSSDNFASSGGVTLFATGNVLAAQQDDLRAELVSDAGELENSQNNSNVIINALGEVDLTGVDVQTTDDFRITTNGDVAFSDIAASTNGDFRVISNGAISFDESIVTAQSDIRLDGTELRFGRDDLEQARTELTAVNGGLLARSTTGDILNYGSLLQGATSIGSDEASLGGISIYSAGDFLNQSLSVDHLAVAFGEIEDLYIETGGDVLNYTGRLFSNAGITIDAGGDIRNETAFTTEVSPFVIGRSKGKRFASSLFLRRSRTTTLSADFGEQAIEGEQSFILGIDNILLRAENIINIGADINGADVSMQIAGAFQNEARQIGRLEFKQSCKWFCKTSGSNDVQIIGGNVTASRALTIEAGELISNLGGRFNGLVGIELTAPLAEFTPFLTAELIESPAGLSGLFSGRRGYLTTSYQFGSLQSSLGSIVINGDAILGDAGLFSLGQVIVTGTRIESDLPDPIQPFERRPLGAFWNIF